MSGVTSGILRGENSNITVYLPSVTFFFTILVIAENIILLVPFKSGTKVSTFFPLAGQGKKRKMLNVHIFW